MLLKLHKPIINNLTLKEFYNKRNKIIIIRNARGIGDILNCRMLFKTFKTLMPESHLAFACYREYMDLVRLHPYLDEVIDVKDINKENYMISYDISTCCIHYESHKGINNDLHRADIWAKHCGIELQDHDMLLPFIPEEFLLHNYLKIKQLKNMFSSKYNKNGPSVLLCPWAFDPLRSLTHQQMVGLVDMLRRKGLFVYVTHNFEVPIMRELAVPVLVGKSLPEWLSFIHAADYVVSVDTATFHYAGGINKPLTGIFTYADGKLRGKYYDFVLVQKHKDNGNWPCGPCYTYVNCTNSKCKNPTSFTEAKPCLTELTLREIEEGVDKMLEKWKIMVKF